jgi:membrane protease subunit HflK
MAWNEPGNNNDKDRDPWKNTGKSQIPPDLEKILRSVWDKLTGTFGGQSPASPGGSTGLVVFALLAIVIWIGSGFYTIEEAERGVVLRFGKYHETVDPGLRWKVTFIDKVIPVDVESVKSMPSSGFMLTEDENAVPFENSYFVEGIRRILEMFVVADQLKYAPFLHTISAVLDFIKCFLHFLRRNICQKS